MTADKQDLLQGTLDMLVLKTLALGPMHGLGIARRIEQMTRGTFHVKPGSMFPALHRMQQKGWIVFSLGDSENNRRAKYYLLTKLGRKQLEAETRNWEKVSAAIGWVLETI